MQKEVGAQQTESREMLHQKNTSATFSNTLPYYADFWEIVPESD